MKLFQDLQIICTICHMLCQYFVSFSETNLGFQLFYLMLNIINVLCVLQAFIYHTPSAFYQIQRQNRHTICLKDSANIPL